jgi:hypothetical protein
MAVMMAEVVELMEMADLVMRLMLLVEAELLVMGSAFQEDVMGKRDFLLVVFKHHA